MDNFITIGQQSYDWKIINYPWLGLIECTISNRVDLAERLIVIINKNNKDVCSPHNIKRWLSSALQQHWHSCQWVCLLNNKTNDLHINRLRYSLADEKKIAQKLANIYHKKKSLLLKSELKYQLEKLQKKIKTKLPTALQQIYFYMGNGFFGPDYGFLPLLKSSKIEKPTIWECYQSINEEVTASYDWQVPKEFVPFLDWGNAIYSLVDCRTNLGAVWILDTNLKNKNNEWKDCFWLHSSSLMDWAIRWADGNDESGRSLWLEMYRIKGLL